MDSANSALTGGRDVLVIGGGTMGLFTALSLAQQGCKVTVLERHRLWSEASGVNAGSLAVQNKLLPLIPYALAALEVWKRMAALLGCDIGYHQTGGYKIATTPSEVARLHATSEAQRLLGLPVRWMEPDDIRGEAPWLSDQVLAATYCPLDSFASPIRMGPAIRRALLNAGADIVEGVEIETVSASGTGIRVETSGTSYSACALVIAAGAWSGRIAACLGVHLPVALDVNMVSVTEPAPFVIGKVVTHARGILTLKQVSNGSCLIGGGWQGTGTLDNLCKEIEPDQLLHNFILANRVIPGLGPLHIVRSWAGYEGVTPDSLPYLGRLPGHSCVYIAACARGGFTLGPLFGQLLGEFIVKGQTSMPIDIFDPGRSQNG